MRNGLFRRSAVGAVAVLVAGAGMLAGGGSAYASDDALHVSVQEYGLTLPRGVHGPAGTKFLHVEVAHDLAGHVPQATLTVDAGGLAGVADVTWPKECTHSGTTGTCTITHVDDSENWDGVAHRLAVGLTAAAGAKDGAHGTIGFTVTAPGLTSDHTESDITVGSGADLEIAPLEPVDHAKIGSVLPAHIEWANTGNQTTKSTVVTLEAIAGLEFTQRFSNCTYGKPEGLMRNVTAVCTINTPLAPGHALALSPDVKLKVTSEAYYTLMAVQVAPPGEKRNTTHQSAPGVRGAGPVLTATPVTASRLTRQTAVINPNDSYTELEVRADNHAHYSAIGANVRGDKGRTVPVTVGMRNNGPALIFDRSGGEGVDALLVTFPRGATAVTVPKGCSLVTKGVKGTGPYECGRADSYVQGPGYKAVFTFKVRLDQQLTNARGTAALTNQNHDMDGSPVTFPWDTSTAGYTAPIVFNGPVTTTRPSTPASTGSGNAPSADGQSQSLAATGGGSNTPLIAGAAAAVAAAGAGILIVTRRRRSTAR
jgi:LPXTG-motif cell wall-anchored protein